MFSDLHCHPALFTFNRLRNSSVDQDPERFHPWADCNSNQRARQRASRATRYTQVSPTMMAEGPLRLAFASITPIERGFFTGGEVETQSNWKLETLALASGITTAMSVTDLVMGRRREATERALRVLKNPGPFRTALQRIFLGYPMSRIRYLNSHAFDYWDEFHREYVFYQNADGKQTDGGRYELIRDTQHLEETFADPYAMAMVHTIEGAHTFSIDASENVVPDDVIDGRIDTLKSLEWPLLFITLAHHFDNGICGHAKSLMDVGSAVMDQSPRMNEGFDEERGERIVRRLLGLTENLEDDGTHRILIDCKHMSPRSRKQYYETIVKPYNDRRDASEKPISVVMSHAGFNGVDSLDHLIENEAREQDGYYEDDYLAWGINYCRDDVRAVHDSEGLIGLCFDQRIMSSDGNKTKTLVDHIFAAVDTIWDDPTYAHNRHDIWERICIGSDFDGMIDPISRYPTAAEFSIFRDDLRQALRKANTTRGIAEIGVDAILENICWKNGYHFAMRHLPERS